MNEWPESDERSYVGECASCGQRRRVVVAPDPYCEDVYPGEADNPAPAPWCASCYSDRCDEV